MKNKKLFAICIALLIAGSATIGVVAQTDLNTRKAVYFTGAKTDAIDLKNDVYVASGATLNLSAELRTSCDNNVCEFNVGLIAMKSGSGAVSTEVEVQTGSGTFSKQVAFGASETSKQVILPIKLKLGKNQIKVSIDGKNTITEGDESNNSFSATVMVNWKRANPGSKN